MKLFHYTPVFSAVMILRDGVIRRSSGKTPPYVWLSSTPTNEPTANRAVLSPEQFRQCDAHVLGAQRQARFVFYGCVATPWADLRLPSAERRNLKLLDEHERPLFDARLVVSSCCEREQHARSRSLTLSKRTAATISTSENRKSTLAIAMDGRGGRAMTKKMTAA